MGIGSSLKKAIRKVIPNELSEVAVAAAPFVAPFNPAIAAAMSGIGSFDQTGRIGSSLKSGIGTYALGQGARWLGGAGFQDPTLSSFTKEGFRSGFSSPLGDQTGIGKLLSDRQAAAGTAGTADTPASAGKDAFESISQAQDIGPGIEGAYNPNASTLGVDQLGASLEQTTGATLKDILTASWEDKLKIAGEWWSGLKPETRWQLGIGTAAAAVQYLENKAIEENRIDLELGEAPGYMTADRGTNPVFTNPNLSIGQYVKDGGIIGLANGGEPTMEMDYRGGGFIPVGAQERADDVPARLSKNEFVMTADAVRAAGGGSVDVGAQRMYDLMNRLEAVA
jgi:hypothetical protein